MTIAYSAPGGRIERAIGQLVRHALIVRQRIEQVRGRATGLVGGHISQVKLRPRQLGNRCVGGVDDRCQQQLGGGVFLPKERRTTGAEPRFPLHSVGVSQQVGVLEKSAITLLGLDEFTGLELVVGDPLLRHRCELVSREAHHVIGEQLKSPGRVAGLMVQPGAVELRLRQCRVRRVVGHPAGVLENRRHPTAIHDMRPSDGQLCLG